MASRPSLAEHYKLDAQIYSDHTVHIRKVLRVEEREMWKHVKKIGWGSFGTVWLQEKMSEMAGHREQRAVKVLEKGKMKQMNIDYMKELEALTEFRMPKILKEEVLVNFYGWFENEDRVFLAMEYFPLGDLERYISINSITERDTKDITVDLLKAVSLMHAEGFTHRDIKPQNILVLQDSPKWFVKLGDFGITKRTSSATTALRTNAGTPLYSAPEIGFDGMDEDDVYTNAVDLWSVGCVVYHILAQRAPFKATSQAKTKPFPIDHIVGRVSADGIDFISKLLVLEPARRLAAVEALAHPWLVDVHPDESTSDQMSQSDMSTQMSLQSWGKQNSDDVPALLSTDIEPHSGTEKRHGPKSQSNISTQMSLQSWRKQNSDDVPTLLSTNVESHSGTEKGHVIDKPRSQSQLQSGGDNGLLTEMQEHRSPLIMQPEGYRSRTQHIVDRTMAGSDAARDEHPPSSQIGKAKHSPEGQQRSANSTLPPAFYETPPNTLGIETKPSIIGNAVEILSTPMASVLPNKRLTSTTALKTSEPATLREACEKGDITSVRDIVRNGVDVESIYPRDDSRRTAIHYASISGHLNIVEFLLNSGAKVNACDAFDATPLHFAAKEGHSGTVRLLLDEGARVDSIQQAGRTPLHEAAEFGHVSVVRELLEHGADINMQSSDSEGFTALSIAAQNNHKDIISLLIAANANIDMQDFEGCTALYVAAENNCEDIVDLLLAANANVTIQNRYGWAALHVATKKNRKDIVNLLLAANADVNMQDFEGGAALHVAAQRNCKDIVNLLLVANADVNMQSSEGFTALYLAAQNNCEDIIDLLLAANADITIQNRYGWAALHAAARNNRKDVVNLLLAANADVNMQSFKGSTALHLAAQNNCEDIVDLLLATNADINLQDSEGWTALHVAAGENHKDIVSLLLAATAQSTLKNKNGMTALHVAGFVGNVETMELLLQTATNISAKDSQGRTALHYAILEGHEEVVKLFAIRRGMQKGAFTRAIRKVHKYFEA